MIYDMRKKKVGAPGISTAPLESSVIYPRLI